MNFNFPELITFLSSCEPRKYKVINPAMLPKLVMRSVGTKLIAPAPTSEPPTTTTKSLGEGGNMFSMYEKNNNDK